MVLEYQVFLQLSPTFGKVYLSDFKPGSINAQKELGSLLSLSSRFPAFTSTLLLVAKLSGLLLSISPAANVSSKTQMLCFRGQFEAIP